jgi:hypothetical protein
LTILAIAAIVVIANIRRLAAIIGCLFFIQLANDLSMMGILNFGQGSRDAFVQ